jgi:hypothetical protein
MAITFKQGDIVKITYVEYGPERPGTVVVFNVKVETYEDGLLQDAEGRVFNLRSAAFVKVEPEGGSFEDRVYG